DILDEEIDWLKEKITAHFRDVEGIMPGERVRRFAEGRGDKIPVYLWLADEWGAHYTGFKLSEICLDAKKLVYSYLNICWRFRLEMWGSVFPHYYQLGPSAVGLKIEFPEDGPPVSPKGVINDFRDVEKLRVPDMRTGGHMPYHWEAYGIWKEKLSDLYPSHSTFVGGPFDFAAQLRGVEGLNLVTDVMDKPGLVKELCDFAADCIIEIARIYREYGIHILFLSQVTAVNLSPDDYMELEFPYVLKIRDAVKNHGMTVSLSRQRHPEVLKRIFEEGMTLMGRTGPVIFTGNYYFPKKGYFPSLDDILSGHRRAKEEGCPHNVYFLGQWLYDTSPGKIRRTIRSVFEAVGPV
ncbi:MAG: hypothetical protein L0213_12955, partial [Candidatus Dadabacteria bacterium]|nr:hypothetical protein [Candidatus Dadabacteria bacterium]